VRAGIGDVDERLHAVEHGEELFPLGPQGGLGVPAGRDVVHDRVEQLPAPETNRPARDLDVPDRAVGKAVPEPELALFLFRRLLHLPAHQGLAERVDVADAHGLQRPGRVPVKPQGSPVGVHDPAVPGVDDQHDGVAVAKEARIQIPPFPQGGLAGCMLRLAALFALRSARAFPRLRVGRRFCNLPLLAGRWLFRTLCRHAEPLGSSAGEHVKRPPQRFHLTDRFRKCQEL